MHLKPVVLPKYSGGAEQESNDLLILTCDQVALSKFDVLMRHLKKKPATPLEEVPAPAAGAGAGTAGKKAKALKPSASSRTSKVGASGAPPADPAAATAASGGVSRGGVPPSAAAKMAAAEVAQQAVAGRQPQVAGLSAGLAASKPGLGSTFHVELVLPIGETALASSEDPAAAPSPGLPLSILAVDDNAVNLMVLDQILSTFGHQVSKAASGHEALDRLSVAAFDLVLMDIQMPGMTGIEALTALRGAPGPNQDTPVIAVTADVLTRDRKAYVDLGFDGQVSRPVQIPALMAELAGLSDERTVLVRTTA
jgi:CheY-like chemotaxis protein